MLPLTLGLLGTLLMALLVVAAVRMNPSPRSERRAWQRSSERAAAVAEALGIVAEQDLEIPTIFRLDATDPCGPRCLWMGSLAILAGTFKGDEIVDWMKLRAPGPAGLSAGMKVRSAGRTYFEWHDGLPGEAPTLVTPGGARLVIENEDGADLDIVALTAWVDSLPQGVWLVEMSQGEIELRADRPATEDAVSCARMLLDRARTASGI